MVILFLKKMPIAYKNAIGNYVHSHGNLAIIGKYSRRSIVLRSYFSKGLPLQISYLNNFLVQYKNILYNL